MVITLLMRDLTRATALKAGEDEGSILCDIVKADGDECVASLSLLVSGKVAPFQHSAVSSNRWRVAPIRYL